MKKLHKLEPWFSGYNRLEIRKDRKVFFDVLHHFKKNGKNPRTCVGYYGNHLCLTGDKNSIFNTPYENRMFTVMEVCLRIVNHAWKNGYKKGRYELVPCLRYHLPYKGTEKIYMLQRQV